MTHTIVSRNKIGSGAQPGFAGAGTLASGLWRAAKRFLNPPAPTARQRRVMQRLERLDEYLVADIGISRSDIPYVFIEGGRPSPRRRRIRRR
jgi:uncharacterized protein YjiS (DUF1127 family)